VVPQGAGVVKTGDVGPQHRPYEQGSGWVTPPQIDQWKGPPGIEHVDALVSAQDARDRLERIKEAAEIAALRKAEAEFLKTKERKNKEAK
jgi:hypothetical protein